MRYTRYGEHRLDYVFVLPVHKKPGTYGKGRICSHCGTILTVYNPNSMCLAFHAKLKNIGIALLEEVRNKQHQSRLEEKSRLNLLERIKRLGRKVAIHARRSRRERTWKNRLHSPISPIDMFV